MTFYGYKYIPQQHRVRTIDNVECLSQYDMGSHLGYAIPAEHEMKKVQSSTEVSQEMFKRILKQNPLATLGFQPVPPYQRTLTLPSGIQYYTSSIDLGV